MDPMQAHRALIDFAGRRGVPPLQLAMHVALPQRFRTELLHLIRLNFIPEADMPAESDVLLADFCQDLGGGYYRFDPEVQSELLDALVAEYAGESEPRIRSVARFLAAYVAEGGRAAEPRSDPVSREYLAILGWVSLAYLDPDNAALQLAKALEGSIAAGDGESRLRLSGVVASVAQPLVSYQRLLTYAAGLQAKEEGRTEDAEKLLKETEWLEIAPGVAARAAAELLPGVTKTRVRQAFVPRSPEYSPHFGEEAPGNVRDLSFLETAWEQGTNFVQILGKAGAGKTSLMQKWFRRHVDKVSVFVWYFYHPGASDEFLRQLAQWLGLPPLGADVLTVDVLTVAGRLREDRVLMVLGGMENLLAPDGKLSDPLMKPLLHKLAASNAGMVAVGTQIRIADIPDEGIRALSLVIEDGVFEQGDGPELDQWGKLSRVLKQYHKSDRKRPLSIAALCPAGADLASRVMQAIRQVFEEKVGVQSFDMAQVVQRASDFESACHVIAEASADALQVAFWQGFDADGYRWLPWLTNVMHGEYWKGKDSFPIGNCIFVCAGQTTWQQLKSAPNSPAFMGRISTSVSSQDPSRNGTVFFVDWEATPAKTAGLGEWFLSCAERGYGFELIGRRTYAFGALAHSLRCRLLVCRDEALIHRFQEDDAERRLAATLFGDIRRPVFAARPIFALSCDWIFADSASTPVEAISVAEKWIGEHDDAESQEALFRQQIALFESVFGRESGEAAKAREEHAAVLGVISVPRHLGAAIDAPEWMRKLQNAESRTGAAEARKILQDLAMVGLRLEPGVVSEREEWAGAQRLRESLEDLAEAEHETWVTRRLEEGWRYSPVRDKSLKLLPHLMTYSALTEEYKEANRKVVRNNVEHARQAGLKVVEADLREVTREMKTGRGIRRVFLSSTFPDLQKERDAVCECLSEWEVRVANRESFESPRERLRHAMRGCDAFIGIYRFLYGSGSRTEAKSTIELEYEMAREAGIPMLVFFSNEGSRSLSLSDLNRTLEFRNRIQREVPIRYFSFPGELTRRLREDMATADSGLGERQALFASLPPHFERAEQVRTSAGIGFRTVCILPGDEREDPNQANEAILREWNRRLASGAAHVVGLYWPDESHPGKAAERLIHQLRSYPGLLTGKTPIIVQHRISIEETPKFIGGFREYMVFWSQRPADLKVILLFNLVYAPDAARARPVSTVFAALSKGRNRGKAIGLADDMCGPARSLGFEAIVLPEIKPVSLAEAEEWLSSELVGPGYSEERREKILGSLREWFTRTEAIPSADLNRRIQALYLETMPPGGIQARGKKRSK